MDKAEIPVGTIYSASIDKHCKEKNLFLPIWFKLFEILKNKLQLPNDTLGSDTSIRLCLKFQGDNLIPSKVRRFIQLLQITIPNIRWGRSPSYLIYIFIDRELDMPELLKK